jgi:hypothetical protein
MLKVALGAAVPAIEAWYLLGRRRGVTEAAWAAGQRSRRLPYTRNQLKQWVYGTDRPSLALETQHAEAEARRLCTDLDQLAVAFPIGVGELLRELRSW